MNAIRAVHSGNQEPDELPVRLMDVKNLILATAFLMAVGACAASGETVDADNPGGPSTSGTVADLATWCGAHTPDRCIEGLVYLDWNPGSERCVFAATDDSRSFWELCDEVAATGLEPVTTVPNKASETERLGAEEDFERELARRLPLLDERAFDLLKAVHPDGVVTAGLVLAEPLPLADAEQVAKNQGGVVIAAWRTGYVCLPGLEDWPINTASRFAYLDGAERARQLREDLENSTTPVTGAHIPLNAFAVMEQEAVALREPGVLIEAVQATVPVGSLESFRDNPRIEKVRLADFPIEWFDLTEPPVPDCGTS